MARFSVGDKVRCIVTWSDADESIKAGHTPSPGDKNRFICVTGDEGIVVSFDNLATDQRWQSDVLGGRAPSSHHDFELLKSLNDRFSKEVMDGKWVPVRFYWHGYAFPGATRIWNLDQPQLVRPDYLEKMR